MTNRHHPSEPHPAWLIVWVAAAVWLCWRAWAWLSSRGYPAAIYERLASWWQEAPALTAVAATIVIALHVLGSFAAAFGTLFPHALGYSSRLAAFGTCWLLILTALPSAVVVVMVLKALGAL